MVKNRIARTSHESIEISAVNSVDNVSTFGNCMQYDTTSHHLPDPLIVLPPEYAINNFPNFDDGDSGADVSQWLLSISFHPPATIMNQRNQYLITS
jgi:hypothetical protein